MARLVARLACIAVVALSLPATALATDPPPGPPPAPPTLPSLPKLPQLPQAKGCVVPALKGLTVNAATRRLAARGCRVGQVTKVSARGVRSGVVVAQSARAGTSLAAGARIALKVSGGRI
jgi:hypothetical protein